MVQVNKLEVKAYCHGMTSFITENKKYSTTSNENILLKQILVVYFLKFSMDL